jgi:enamine deaminase RidA (YjgF/YER057c/UK114 family)
VEIERHHSNNRMSQIVIAGDYIHLAGQVAYDRPSGTVADQTRATLSRIETLLAEAGSDKSRIISATIWLSDIASFDEMNHVWDAWLVPGHAPARATVEARLASKDYSVEIAVVAAR